MGKSKPKALGRILYHDPNPEGSELVPLEDLSIMVEMTVSKKPRSVISNGGIRSIKGTNGKMSFLEGTPYGTNKQNTLTTNYTDIGTEFTKPSDDALEGFGMTDIQIGFDTAYTPLVKIKFVDVRGGMMTRQSLAPNDNKYNIFFDLPYPLFNLTVKGYFGKAVSYCLHMTKWNGRFNTNTGNFEIDAEFIGYTYAILTDMLMGYLKAIPYTELGAIKLSGITEEYKDSGIEILTIDEMLLKISQLNDNINEFKSTDKDYKKLIAKEKTTEVLSRIKQRMGTFLLSINDATTRFVGDDTYITIRSDLGRSGEDANGNAIWIPGQDASYNTNYKKIIEDYHTEIEGLVNELNQIDEDADADFNKFKVIVTKTIRPIDVISETTENSPESPADVFRQNDNYTVEEESRCLTLAAKIESGIRADSTLSGATADDISGVFMVFDLFRGANEFNRIISENCYIREKIKNDLIKTAKRDATKDLSFNPTIKSLVRILTTHCEILLECIQDVAYAAETDINGERSEVLNKLNRARLNTPPKVDNIYAFPEFNDDGVEGWLGNEINSEDFNKVPELTFTQNLLDALIKSKQRDVEAEILTRAGEVDWWALTPLDTKLVPRVVTITDNPYQLEEITNHEEILRVLMYRMFLYLGRGIVDIDDKLLAMMAKFEANNLFYSITDGTLRDAIGTNYDSGGKIKEHLLAGSDQINNYLGKLTKIPYMKVDDNGDYQYTYLKQTFALDADGNGRRPKYYIPVSGGWSGEIFYNGNTFKSETDLVPLGSSTLFVSNYINGDSGKIKNVDGARYIDIIGANNYSESSFNKPIRLAADAYKEYTDTIVESNLNLRPNQNDIDNSLEPDTPMKRLNPIAGKFGSMEFFEINADGSVDGERNADSLTKLGNGNTMVAPLFYSDSKNGSVLARRTPDDDDTLQAYGERGNNMSLVNSGLMNRGLDLCVPKIEFGYSTSSSNNTVILQSLFGSQLYYAQISSPQEMLAKAYLFVNTFPMRGIKGVKVSVHGVVDQSEKDTLFGNDVDYGKTISGLFSNSSGFIKAPTLWCYWVGSILWRHKFGVDNSGADPIKTTGVISNTVVTLVPNFVETPNTRELFYSLSETKDNLKPPLYVSGSFTNNSNSDAIYKRMDETLMRLPEQAKEVFIEMFTNWATNDFIKIDEKFRMPIGENLQVTTSGLTNFTDWTATHTNDLAQYESNNSLSNLNPSYQKIIPIDVNSGYNYDLILNLDSQINKEMVQLMLEESVIANYSPLTFRKSEVNGESDTIKIDGVQLDIFLNGVADEYKKLYNDFKKGTTNDDVTKNEIFHSTNNTDILLNVYRYLSALSNKWIGEYTTDASLFFPCSTQITDTDKAIVTGETRTRIRLIDTFRFVDKAFNNIGDDFIINPRIMASMLSGNYNQSFFDYVNRILADNNFNFIPLPAFVNFNDGKSVEEIFKPLSYKDAVNAGTVGPTFVCVYVGQLSSHLDLGNLSEYDDDGLNLRPDGIRKDKSFNTTPNLSKGEMYAPVFEVNYAQQNQSYFKDIRLDQSEFTETEESLTIIDDLSKSADKNKGAYMGQNLFNIYQNRSYSAEVEAMGMPLIQPMMYFQLNNIPMFRGAYLIISTEHHIKPNYMETKFKGVRIKDVATPLYKSAFEIMDFLGDVDDCGKNLSFKGDNIYFIDTVKDDSFIPSPLVDIDAATEDYYNYGYKIGFPGYTSTAFSNKSNTSGSTGPLTYEEIFQRVSRITKVPVDILKVMSVCESAVGTNKGNKNKPPSSYQGSTFIAGNDGMNTGAYVGLMQFGKPAALQVKTRVEGSVFTPSNSDLRFFSQTTGNKALIPDTWSTATTMNNKSTNSFFDDYINVMGTAYLAIDNMGTVAANINNVVDVYLSHQQGKTGLSNIKREPLSDVDGNAINNPPPLADPNELNTLLNKEWYAAWAGKVESVAVQVNPNYKSSMNDQFPNANKLRKELASLGYEEKGSSLTSSNRDITKRMEELSTALFKKVKKLYPNLGIKVSAGNDASHAGTSSRHDDGQAIDFTVLDNNGRSITQQGNYKTKKNGNSIANTYTPSQEVIIDNIVVILQGFVAGNKSDGVAYLDEYTLGSEYASGPHFHFSYKIGGDEDNEGGANRIAALEGVQNGTVTPYTV